MSRATSGALATAARSTATNPSNTYATPGTYTVTLVATGPGGAAVTTKVGYVSVAFPAPVANFSAAPTSGNTPLPVQFTNQTTGNVTGYQWSFGDGGTSTDASPSHSYTAAGAYTVILTATGPGGTSVATKTDYIVANHKGPEPDFTASPTSGTTPLAVQFTNQTTGNVTGYQWSFGDGGMSNATNPNYTYATPGIYTVTLTATGSGGTAMISKPGYIVAGHPAPVAGFTGAPTSGIAPLAVQFTNQTSGEVTSYQWSFGDGGTSTAANPGYTYTTPGTYAVTLTATGPGGTSTASRPAYIVVADPAPVANFTGAPASGTAPLAVLFTNQTTGNVTGYQWSFGDGGTSTASNPSHTYTAPGAYTVTLVATGPGGAGVASKASYISVAYPAPVAGFTALPTSGIAPLAVQFNNQTTGNATGYQWVFGDGGTSTATDPSRTYATPGVYAVTLTATGPGGTDVETRASYITVAYPAPAPGFTAAPTSGTAPLAVQFTNQTTGNVTGYQWVFGDGGVSTAASPSHSYSAPGVYTVTLTATGPGGTAAASRASYISVAFPAPVAAFVASPTSGDAALAVQFTNQSTGNITGYQWSFGDGGSSTATDPSRTYTTPGIYTVTLTATGPGGASTASRPSYITVDQPAPVPAFTGSPTSARRR